jgi:hypothetical protein
MDRVRGCVRRRAAGRNPSGIVLDRASPAHNIALNFVATLAFEKGELLLGLHALGYDGQMKAARGRERRE